MRGIDEKPAQLSSYVDLERRIAPDHPLRVRALGAKVLVGQSRAFTSSSRRTAGRAFRPSGFCALCFFRPSPLGVSHQAGFDMRKKIETEHHRVVRSRAKLLPCRVSMYLERQANSVAK